MMKDGTLRRVSWRRLCPWLILVRAPKLATRLPLLLLGFVAAILLPIGWDIAFLALQPELAPPPQLIDHPRLARPTVDAAWELTWSYGPRLLQARLAWWGLMLSRIPTWSGTLYLLFGATWSLVVWSFFGGVISRIAVARLGPDQRVGIRDAIELSFRKLRALLMAPLMPLAALLLAALLPMAMGWLASLGEGPAFAAAMFWGLALAAGVAMTLLAAGSFLGWPLMPPAIMAEKNGDAFEAISRSFAYCSQRPFHLAFYSAVAAVIGGATWVLVSGLFQLLIWLTMEAAVWGGGAAHLMLEPTDATASVMRAWIYLINTFAAGFHFTYFWVAASAIYLLMRHQVDETELDEVDLGDGPPALQLPSMKPPPDADAPSKPETGDRSEANPSPPADAAAGGDSKAGDAPGDDSPSADKDPTAQ